VFAEEKNEETGIPEGLGKINPVLLDYSSNITFYLNCDSEDMLPAMAAGDSKVRTKAGTFTFEKGLFGKALRSGRATYTSKAKNSKLPNIDLSSPGTLIIWLSPWNWKKVEKEGYFWPFIAFAGNKKIQIGRQGDKWGKARIYAYITNQGGENTYLPMYGHGSGHNWKQGVWHMVALSWDPESLGLSVDGSAFSKKTLESPFKHEVSWFLVGAQKNEKGFQVLQDEFVILNKQLSDQEIKTLFDKTMDITTEVKE
jgi:hypothetical protein